MIEVPGVSGHARAQRLGGRGEPEFRGGRLAEADNAEPQKRIDQRRLRAAFIAGKGAAAETGRNAGHIVEVLDEARNAGPRPRCLADALSGAVKSFVRDRVDFTVNSPGALNRGVNRFGG